MRYASIRSMDISNGEGIGVALFVQGCHFHCKNCFNSETWGFNGGYPWTESTKQQFLELINKPHITRVSLLGGEPLADENAQEILLLIEEIKKTFPTKKIWLYTGYTWESLMNTNSLLDNKGISDNGFKYGCVINTDVLVEGPFIDEKKDLRLKWCGSSNQRIIDVQKSLKQNKICLYEKNMILS